jgi:AcrR family transcriptional regulator
MSTNLREKPRAASEDTKNQIKAAAQLLFARHGVDAVTIQQIVAAAGQRNNAALHYHFGSKEELIRQLVVDGAAVLDARRQDMLREMAARGGPASIREVLLILMMPVIELGEDERWRGYIRFTSNLQAVDRKTLRAALNDRWNAGYVTCFDHLKRMLPLPAPLVEQRLSLFSIYANAILSAREAAREIRKSEGSRLWDYPFTTENILDTLESVLTCAPSASTLAMADPKVPGESTIFWSQSPDA